MSEQLESNVLKFESEQYDITHLSVFSYSYLLYKKAKNKPLNVIAKLLNLNTPEINDDSDIETYLKTDHLPKDSLLKLETYYNGLFFIHDLSKTSPARKVINNLDINNQLRQINATVINLKDKPYFIYSSINDYREIETNILHNNLTSPIATYIIANNLEHCAFITHPDEANSHLESHIDHKVNNDFLEIDDSLKPIEELVNYALDIECNFIKIIYNNKNTDIYCFKHGFGYQKSIFTPNQDLGLTIRTFIQSLCIESDKATFMSFKTTKTVFLTDKTSLEFIVTTIPCQSSELGYLINLELNTEISNDELTNPFGSTDLSRKVITSIENEQPAIILLSKNDDPRHIMKTISKSLYQFNRANGGEVIFNSNYFKNIDSFFGVKFDMNFNTSSMTRLFPSAVLMGEIIEENDIEQCALLIKNHIPTIACIRCYEEHVHPTLKPFLVIRKYDEKQN